MTLNEFNILPFEEKYRIAIDNSIFLNNNFTKEEVYETYSFNTFYVEIVYDENLIVEIRSYTAAETIYRFTGKIEIF